MVKDQLIVAAAGDPGTALTRIQGWAVILVAVALLVLAARIAGSKKSADTKAATSGLVVAICAVVVASMALGLAVVAVYGQGIINALFG